MIGEKTVYLHIGNFKTGTSAIQSFCSAHIQDLYNSDVDYVQAGRAVSAPDSHASIPLSLIQAHGGYVPAWYGENCSSSKLLGELRKEILHSNCNQILISSEEFYRIAGYNDKAALSMMNELASALPGFDVRVIIYVRPPLDFLKSWYNQANKGTSPTLRFTDFAYHTNPSLLVPTRNANLWRRFFGRDCLIVEPYTLRGKAHIQRFLSLVNVEIHPENNTTSVDINPKREESTLELDRVARIMALPPSQERDLLLRGDVLSSPDKLERLKIKLQRVNEDFHAFCRQELLPFEGQSITLSEILDHDSVINHPLKAAPSWARVMRAKFQRSQFAARLKPIAKRFL